MSSRFWADWDSVTCPGQTIRRDTRIYWQPQSTPCTGRCIGTFIGENPGSGHPAIGPQHCGYDHIIDWRRRDGDATLRLISDIWDAAVAAGKLSGPRDTDYLEILNTYYFRSSTSGAALIAWRTLGGSTIYAPGVNESSGFVLLGCGVGHSSEPETQAALRLIPSSARVLIPSPGGTVTVTLAGALSWPLVDSPVSLSYVVRRPKALLPKYREAVVAAI